MHMNQMQRNNDQYYAQLTVLFHQGERYRVLDMDVVPLEDQYEMCGLFKQSTFGDIDIKCKLVASEQ